MRPGSAFTAGRTPRHLEWIRPRGSAGSSSLFEGVSARSTASRDGGLWIAGAGREASPILQARPRRRPPCGPDRGAPQDRRGKAKSFCAREVLAARKNWVPRSVSALSDVATGPFWVDFDRRETLKF